MLEVGPGLTVLCVTFNSSDVLEPAIASVRRAMPDAHVLVVDNGSGDDSVAVAERAGARVISTGANLGFGAAVNRGVAATQTDHVLVLNPDARIVRSAWPASALAGRPFGLVALSETTHESSSGDSASSVSRLVRPQLAWFVELPWSLANWLLVPREVTWKRPPSRRERLDGAAFVVRRDEFLDVGGFDERLFLYYEDNQLTAEYRNRGLPLRASDAIVVEHDSAGSSPRLHEKVVAWALLSQIQGVFIEHGARAGRRAAWAAVRGLQSIVWLGSVGARVPVLSGRARVKQASAAAILTHLAAEATTPPRPGAYPDAASALLHVARSSGSA